MQKRLGTTTVPFESPLADPQVREAAAAVRRYWNEAPRAGLILGTGMSNVARLVEERVAIPYDTIPHFPCSTAVGHRGQLVCGFLHGVPVITMDGRCHLYEGYPVDQVVLPVRMMRALGIELLVVSNASGGLNPQLKSGDIVVIEDHLNFMGPMPQSGRPEVSGRTLRQGTSPYDAQLIERALAVARREDFPACRGVYVGVSGPNYETRAEYRFFRRIGGDVVGMSTIPEVIAAHQLGLRILALSTVTNVACPDAPQVVRAEDVIAAAERAEPRVSQIVLDAVQSV